MKRFCSFAKKIVLRDTFSPCLLIFFLSSAIFVFWSGASSLHAAVGSSAGWFINMNRFASSAHGTFTCEVCHGTMVEGGKKHPDPKNTELLKTATSIYDYSRCNSCHRTTYTRYLKGAHARALKEKGEKGTPNQLPISEEKGPPTCGHCHSVHYCKSHLSRAETGRQMTDVCGSCHLPQKVTYLENFHGKTAVNLRNEASAYCTDCHGAHHCLSLKDRKVALSACQRCHPKARDRFAEFVIHPTTIGLTKDDKEKRERVVIIKAVSAIMSIIVILVVSFFYGHSFVWLLRELHERLRKHR